MSLDQIVLWPAHDCLVTVDAIMTADTSPELHGRAPRNVPTVDITVDGNLYAAVPVVNGVWVLAAGVITPPLVDGTYDVIASALCDGEVVTDKTVNELTVGAALLWIWAANDSHTWAGANDFADFIT